MHQTLLKLRISQEEAAMKVIFSTIHRREEHFTEEAFTKEPMNFNDYLN
jgi:hypothetical protein